MEKNGSFGTLNLPGGGRFLLYRAEKTVSVSDLAPLCGTSARELCKRLRKGFLLRGEWAALPEGDLRFCRVGADGDPFAAAREWGGKIYLPQSAAAGNRYGRTAGRNDTAPFCAGQAFAEQTSAGQAFMGQSCPAPLSEAIRKENALPFFYVGCAVAIT